MLEPKQPRTSEAREENVAAFALRGGVEATTEAERVWVQLATLRALGGAHGKLEHFVRAAFAAQQRFRACLLVSNLLSQSKQRPAKLKSNDYWWSVDDALTGIAPLCDSLDLLELIKEDEEFAKWANEFDDELKKSADLVGPMRMTGQEGDATQAVSQLQRGIRKMTDASTDMLRRCEREASTVISAINNALGDIFTDIQAERRALEIAVHQQVAPMDVSALTETLRSPSSQGQTASQPTQNRDVRGREEVQVATRQSESAAATQKS